MQRSSALRALAIVSFLLLAHRAASADEPKRFEFTRMVAHWANYGDPGYMAFIEDAQPELVQLGFYGAHFWSLAHTPQYKGYPAHFPVQGLSECGAWFAEKNRALHERNVKVIGHMNVKFLVGEPDGPDGPRGFFKFYRDLWDAKLLGPKPVDDPADFLERQRDGTPIIHNSYRIGGMHEYWACLNNPHWRQVLKAWVGRGVAQGVDGFIANYFYRHDCHCRHCVAGFKSYLSKRYTPEELRQRFQIADLAAHEFPEIVCWHKPEESTPLRREMLRWSQIANKRAFDEVFVEHGRSLKPGLVAAQWDHLGAFGQINGDERCLLPAELWGKGEDYLWYSAGGSACYSDLADGYLGDVTLQARYVRGAFDDKPFTIGKYEGTRIRMAIAELAANGGAPMGFYTRFTDPDARREIVRYYQFMKRHDDLFHANRSHAEAALIYPRSKVHQGNVQAVAQFKQIGLDLLNRHVLFDVLPDDLATPERLASYLRVIDPTRSDSLQALPADLSRVTAPQTIRVAASRPAKANELTLHLVNYNRQEPEQRHSAGRGIQDEKPIAAAAVACDLRLPAGQEVVRVVSMTPESPQPVELKFAVKGQRVQFSAPEFLVYRVTRVILRPTGAGQ